MYMIENTLAELFTNRVGKWQGEIGEDIILHMDPVRGEIKLCYKCHKRRHESLNKQN